MRRRLVRMLGAVLERADPPRAADAAVVLGARLMPDGSLSAAGEERIRAGVELWRRGLAPVVAVSGGRNRSSPAPIAEAVALARRARALGVPDSDLRVEPESANTADNARLTAKLLLPEGRHHVWVVTQPFHLRRAVFWFRRAGFEPLGHRIEDSLQYRDPALGARWVLQEYASWARLALLEAVPGLARQDGEPK